MEDIPDIDFAHPVALFPLASTALMPNAVQPLHVFEPRYRRMVVDAVGDAADGLDSAAPIAMATFLGDGWRDDYGGTPPLRPTVCVGRIVRHIPLPDGRHDIVLLGTCRARIARMVEPCAGRPYRMAELVPVSDRARPRSAVARAREAVVSVLSRPRLSRLQAAVPLREWIGRPAVPPRTAVDVASHALVNDAEARYRLLEERDPCRRADEVCGALVALERMIACAERQRSDEWPSGQSWN